MGPVSVWPADRLALVQQLHDTHGHFGIKRTRYMLLTNYWWWGIDKDVKKVLAQCEVCSRVNSSFNVTQPELQPLPIEGLFYRWGVDLAGPFPPSTLGNVYVMIMIEYFSKQIEVVALPDKQSRHTAAAFLAAVVARYGACAEVVTD